jgi:adenylosuccinate lyase
MSLLAISPIDGRYQSKTEALNIYFSESALIKYRVFVEIEYFIELLDTLPLNIQLDEEQKKFLRTIYQEFSLSDAERIKEIEEITKHDVKAVEYFIKEKLATSKLSNYQEYVHFALTSQDINNTAHPVMLMDCCRQQLLPRLYTVLEKINQMGSQWKKVPMLARTHGQPASPTTVGKELLVFADRLNKQLNLLSGFRYSGKFGGATGNFNAHRIAFPQIDWPGWSDRFLQDRLDLERQAYTTQIAHYDEMAEWFQILLRINTILIDFCRDLWTYISLDYFKQKVKAGEVGSSAMPHKVNPIDFENAEGNLGISNAMASFLAEKLPISRLQRDLTDSTVLRNMGIPVSHTFLATDSILKGLNKLILNENKIEEELNNQWIILAEAIQTVLRREQYPHAYEVLKDLTRGKENITKKELHAFINGLEIDQTAKEILLKLEPSNYLGYSAE